MKKRKILRIIATLTTILIIIILVYYKESSTKNNTQRQDFSEKVSNVVIIDKYNKMQELYQNPLEEKYVEIDIIIDDNYYNNVGIRTKGSVIYQRLEKLKLDNYSFKVKLDYIDSTQRYNGMNEIHLNSTIYDSTGIREYLIYKIYNKMGIETQNYQLGHLYIGSEDRGLITLVEVINENYLEQKYNLIGGNLYKPVLKNRHEYDGADLRYTDEKIESYNNIFDNTKTLNTTEEDKKRLISIIKNINETSETEVIESYFVDFDKIIKMAAINEVLMNVDTFTTNTLNNYYIYEKNGKIDIYTFDFDISLNPKHVPVSKFPEYNNIVYSRITEIIQENEMYQQKYNKYMEQIKEELKNMNTVVDYKVEQTKNIINSNKKKVFEYREYEEGVKELKDTINKISNE